MIYVPVPIKAEHSSDETDGETFNEKSREHEEHGSDKGNGGAELRGPVLVERNTNDG